MAKTKLVTFLFSVKRFLKIIIFFSVFIPVHNASSGLLGNSFMGNEFPANANNPNRCLQNGLNCGVINTPLGCCGPSADYVVAVPLNSFGTCCYTGTNSPIDGSPCTGGCNSSDPCGITLYYTKYYECYSYDSCDSTDCFSAITNAPCKCGTLTTIVADNGKYCCAGNNTVYNSKAACQVGACAASTPTSIPTCGQTKCANPGVMEKSQYDPVSGSCKSVREPCPLAQFCKNGVCEEPKSTSLILTDAVNALLSILVAAAILFLVYGAVRYLTAAFALDFESGKKIIYYAVLGLFVGGLSYSIIATIYNVVTNTNKPPIAIISPSVSPVSGPPGTTYTIVATISATTSVNPASTIAHIQNPDETDLATVTIYDDGAHSDGAAGDGVYGNTWNSGGFPLGAYYIDINACDTSANCAEAENI